MSTDHSKRELNVFSGFAAVCGLCIVPNSIEKREPPEPDVLCQIQDEGPIAFEMVELLDQVRIARPRGIQAEISDGFRDAYRSLSEGEQARLQERLGNATVRVHMSRAVSSHRRRAAVGELLKLLLDIDTQFEGEYLLPPKLRLLASLKIVRGNFAGPRFTAISDSVYDPTPLKGLEAKFGKIYTTTSPIDLVAYFDSQHAPPENKIVSLQQLIKSLIDSSGFRRVWVYDANERRVCCVVTRGLPGAVANKESNE